MTVPGVYSPEQIAAHVERVIASDGVDDEAKVEVMARAIFGDISGWLSNEFAPWHYEEFKDTARAALKALREMEE